MIEVRAAVIIEEEEEKGLDLLQEIVVVDKYLNRTLLTLFMCNVSEARIYCCLQSSFFGCDFNLLDLPFK